MREFTRVMWTSDSARAVWAPRVAAIQRAWARVELESVRQGLRPAALVFGADTVQAAGLPAAAVAPDRFAVGPGASALAQAYAAQDDDRIGALLGFPRCCRAFFDRVWNQTQLRDTTLSMTPATAPCPEANILGRWLGVRLVPHLPCGFACPATVTLARQLTPVWEPEALAWAETILSWPVRYSALHGVAIITWPVLRVVVSTDYTRAVADLDLEGTSYPEEAPRGLAPPFRPPAHRRVTLGRRRLEAVAS